LLDPAFPPPGTSVSLQKTPVRSPRQGRIPPLRSRFPRGSFFFSARHVFRCPPGEDFPCPQMASDSLSYKFPSLRRCGAYCGVGELCFSPAEAPSVPPLTFLDEDSSPPCRGGSDLDPLYSEVFFILSPFGRVRSFILFRNPLFLFESERITGDLLAPNSARTFFCGHLGCDPHFACSPLSCSAAPRLFAKTSMRFFPLLFFFSGFFFFPPSLRGDRLFFLVRGLPFLPLKVFLPLSYPLKGDPPLLRALQLFSFPGAVFALSNRYDDVLPFSPALPVSIPQREWETFLQRSFSCFPRIIFLLWNLPRGSLFFPGLLFFFPPLVPSWGMAPLISLLHSSSFES